MVLIGNVYYVFQNRSDKTDKDKDTQRESHSSKRRCASCKATLRDSWRKAICSDCINQLVQEQNRTENKQLASSVKELSNSFESLKTLFEGFQIPQPQSASPSTSTVTRIPSTCAGPSITPREEEEEEPDNAVSGSQESEGEAQEGDSRKPSRYKLSLEDVDHLLGAIYTTLGIPTDKKTLTVHDQMYEGLGEQENKFFPVHDILVEAIKKEWQDPERKPFLSKNLKRRFPFSDDPSSVWNKVPKLDAAFSQVSRHTDLAFEDMGILSESMDKKMDSLLKRSWDSTLGSLKPAMAVTVVARNMEFWLNHLQTHIEEETVKEQILSSFPTIMRGIAYIADASAELVRMAARSSALANSTRRALWLKTWQGDCASKTKLCGIPFTGDLLFGPGLEKVLDRTADKKKAFPLKRKAPWNLPQQNKRKQKNATWAPKGPRYTTPKADYQKKPWVPKGKGKGGAIFRPPEQTYDKK